MKNLDELKKIIQAANPGIMALPPYPYNPDAAKAIIELEKIAGKTLWNETLEQTATLMIETYRKQQQLDYVRELQQDYENVGRPIRLADIIYAYLQNLIPARFLIGGYKEDMKFQYTDASILNIVANWQLKDDNLDNQSDECKQFLTELLVK